MLNSLLLNSHTFRFHVQTQEWALGVKMTDLSTLMVMEKAKNMPTFTDKTEKKRTVWTNSPRYQSLS